MPTCIAMFFWDDIAWADAEDDASTAGKGQAKSCSKVCMVQHTIASCIGMPKQCSNQEDGLAPRSKQCRTALDGWSGLKGRKKGKKAWHWMAGSHGEIIPYAADKQQRLAEPDENIFNPLTCV
eukprot:1134250-Pelagomonas_calceolata.AAC.4